MTHDWGRFTARGGAGIEEAIRDAVEDVSTVLEKTLRPEEYRAVVLLGGYGRGEGGVESVDGRERPTTTSTCWRSPAHTNPTRRSSGGSTRRSSPSSAGTRSASTPVASARASCDVRRAS